MANSAEGVVERAVMFTGVVCEIIEVLLLNNERKPITNAKCKVKFQNNVILDAESDANGILKFRRKAPGEFEIQLP